MRSLLLFLFLTALSSVSISQDVNNLAVDATVKDMNGGRLQNAVIILVQDGAEINKVSTGKNGRFDLYLDFGHEYIIEIKKSGYVSKKLSVNTHNVPEDEQAWGYEFGGFIIDLYQNLPGIDFSVFDKPVGKVYYDDAISNFQYDREYAKIIKEETKELNEEFEAKKDLEERLQEQREEEYRMALRDAEAAIKDGDLEMAKENLLAAQGMKPEAKEVAQRISEVNNQITQKKNNEAQYNNTIAEADKLFNDESYTEALSAYRQAEAIAGSDSYASGKINEVEEKIKEQEELALINEQNKRIDEQYSSLIASADEAFNAGKYSDAKSFYNNALTVKTDESYPQEKLRQIETQLADLQSEEQEKQARLQLDAKYKAEIDRANTALAGGNLVNAKTLYTSASDLKPDEELPKTKLREIEDLIAQQESASEEAEKQKELRAKYDSFISSADKAMKSFNYQEAIEDYKSALALKEDETYPKDKIKIAEGRIEENAAKEVEKQAIVEKQALFEQTMVEAKGYMDTEDYDKAIAKYKAAQKLDSSSDLPEQQIKIAEGLLSDKASELANAKKTADLEQLYDNAILKADELLEKGNLDQSKQEYMQALALKAGEKYPTDQIAVIDAKIAKQEAAELAENEKENLRRRADDWIIKADEAFEERELSIAETAYLKSLALVPNQEYALAQLERIRVFVAEEQEEKNALEAIQKEVDEFAALIAKSDDLFDSGLYEQARSGYEQALSKKPSDHAESRIETIIQKLQEAEATKQALEQQQKLQAEYDLAITEADNLFKIDKLTEARARYNEAASLKSNQAYPKDKIAEIDKLIAAKQKSQEFAEKQAAEARLQAEIDAKYQSKLSEGDKFFKSRDFDIASAKYKEALTIKADEAYPKTQLETINRMIAESLQLEQAKKDKKDKYDQLIAQGDKAFASKDWDIASSKYSSAQAVFSSEPYPSSRLKEIKRLKAEFEEAQKKERYEQAITKADQFFQNKQYESAKSSYQKALSFYAEESYPSERLNTIEKILADLDQDEREKVIDKERKIIEEQYDEGRSKITLRRVIVGETEDVYKRVIHSWGGKYFFLNDRPISEFIWNKETAP
jgi:tetratricopeptide (TPR) repeat protein